MKLLILITVICITGCSQRICEVVTPTESYYYKSNSIATDTAATIRITLPSGVVIEAVGRQDNDSVTLLTPAGAVRSE